MHLSLLSVWLLLARLIEADSCSCPCKQQSQRLASKRGIAYNDANLANKFASNCSKCKWAYNWGGTDVGALDPTILYVPMLWSAAADHVQAWKAQAKVDSVVFSFNEPDIAGQANMTAVEAAAAHIKYMNGLPQQVYVGAPAISSSSEPSKGMSWLKDFLKECQNQGGCRFDFCNTHWYSEKESTADKAIGAIFAHLDKLHELCRDKPIWLTEFAFWSNDAEIQSFLKVAIPRLEELAYIEAYSYFWVAPGSLVELGGAPSSIGKVYATIE
ncbi:Glycoside catalytic core [Cordyceps militaris]|uniref:Glycoside catalytic core n=1 Tax=Cordyceps militaris TaxID=73501 RepID=A0A2H4SR68_CORMI|nr:Glycoside catalytic core [Cordyceps militaris]